MGQAVLLHRSGRDERFPFSTRKRGVPVVAGRTPSSYLGIGAYTLSSLSAGIEAALSEARILIFAVRNAQRTGWHTALVRNYVIASMSDESVYAINEEGRSSSLDVLYGLEIGVKPVCLLH